MSCRQLSMLLSLKLPILVALLSPTTSSPLLLCFKLTMVCCVVEPDDVFLTVVAEYEVDNAFCVVEPDDVFLTVVVFQVDIAFCVVERDDVFLTVAEFEVDNSFVAQLSPTTSSFVASRL